MWASSKVTTIVLTTVCTLVLLVIGRRAGVPFVSMVALALPFAVWAWHLRQKL